MRLALRAGDRDLAQQLAAQHKALVPDSPERDSLLR
jgi:hypothetical protein